MRIQRVTKNQKSSRNAVPRGAKSKKKTPKRLSLMASAQSRRRGFLSGPSMELYRPLKKPVTLRLDADVIAWFKKDGRRYQTRINGALRKVMEREMRTR